MSSPRRTLFAASLGFFVVILDTTIVNVALPAIGDDLGGDLGDLQWVVDGYVVAFAALLLSSGALGDRIGVAPSGGGVDRRVAGDVVVQGGPRAVLAAAQPGQRV